MEVARGGATSSTLSLLLPVPVRMDWGEGTTVTNLDKAAKDIASSLAQHLWEDTLASTRLSLL